MARPANPSPPGRPLSRSSAWNLSFNVFSKSQTLALLIAGSVIGGFDGIGVIVTAMGACWVGAALADLGLAAELSRLGIAHPNRAMVRRALRAVAMQAPLAFAFAPLIFYVVLGHRTGSPALLLLSIGALGAALTATIQLTGVLNGLGDFRTPAAWLGGARLVSSVVAVVGVALDPSSTVVLGSFAVAELFGLVVLVVAVRRTGSRLPTSGEPVVIRRTHVWLGGAAISNVLTRQSDSILVAWILTPRDLGLYATASALANGVNTFSLAVATPFTFRSIGATLARDLAGGTRLLRKALVIGGVGAVVLAALTWGLTQAAGELVPKIAGLADGNGPIVLALYLASGPLSVTAQVCFWMGIGFGRHRAVGTAQMLGGFAGAALVIVAAQLGGVVAAAAATIVREGILLLLARRVIAPPGEEAPPSTESELEADALEAGLVGASSPAAAQ